MDIAFITLKTKCVDFMILSSSWPGCTEGFGGGKRSRGLKVQGSQGLRYLKLTFKYKKVHLVNT